MRFADVKIMTLAEGEISELHVGLKGTMNALFLKDLAQKTRRGLQGRVLQGLSGGGLCYGYDLLPGETGVRRINESEAKVVRSIFRDYAAGQSPRAIARKLNEKGVSRARRADHGAIRQSAATLRAVPGSSTTSSMSAASYGIVSPILRIPQAAGVGRGSILRTDGLSKRYLHSVSSMTLCGRLSKPVREPLGRAIALLMRVPHASGSAGALATCSAGFCIASGVAVVMPRSAAITSPALLPAAAAPVQIVRASGAVLWRD